MTPSLDPPASLIRVEAAAVALLFSWLAVTLFLTSWRDTITIDEGNHIPAGISYLQLGDPRMNFEHPPLMKLLSATGAVLAGASVSDRDPSWTTTKRGEDVMRSEFQERFAGAPLRRIVAWARAPMVLLTLLLAWIVLIYGRTIGGRWGGLLSLSFFVSTPLVLAFGAYVLNDVAVTLGCLLTCLAVVRVWKLPTSTSAAFFGAALAFALLSKFSAIILIPFSAFCWLALIVKSGEPLIKGVRRILPVAVAGFLVAAAIVWAVYFSTFQHADRTAFVETWYQQLVPRPGTAEFANARKELQVFGQLEQHPLLQSVVMPVFYYGTGVRFVMYESHRPVYLLGKIYPSGRWFYFPVLIATKSTLGFLALLLTGALFGLRKSSWRNLSPEVVTLAIFLSIYSAISFNMNLNLGMRHFMPGIVAMTILLAMLPRCIASLCGTARTSLFVLVVLCAAASLLSVTLQYPYYVPYYNALGLVAPRGWVAADSNVDFGNSLSAIGDFARKHHLSSVPVSPFMDGVWIFKDVQPLATDWRCGEPLRPDQTWVVVSTARFYDALHPGACDYLLQYERNELAGGSLQAVNLSRPHTQY